MRRRLQKFLPVVLLALVVQVLAPIAATWATALGASDPLQAASICHSGAAGSDQDGVPDNGPGSHHAACGVCCLVQASAALDTPRTVAAEIPGRQISSIIWRDDTLLLSVAPTGSNAQARAPPLSM